MIILPKLIQEISDKIANSNLHSVSIVAHGRDKYIMSLNSIVKLSQHEYLNEEKSPLKLESFVVNTNDAREALDFIQKNLYSIEINNPDKIIVLNRRDDSYSGLFIDSLDIVLKQNIIESSIVVDISEKELTHQQCFETFDSVSKDAIHELILESNRIANGRKRISIALTKDIAFYEPYISSVRWIDGHKLENFACEKDYFNRGLFIGLNINLEYNFLNNELTVLFTDYSTNEPVLLFGEKCLEILDNAQILAVLSKPSPSGTYDIRYTSQRYIQ